MNDDNNSSIDDDNNSNTELDPNNPAINADIDSITDKATILGTTLSLDEIEFCLGNLLTLSSTIFEHLSNLSNSPFPTIELLSEQYYTILTNIKQSLLLEINHNIRIERPYQSNQYTALLELQLELERINILKQRLIEINNSKSTVSTATVVKTE